MVEDFKKLSELVYLRSWIVRPVILDFWSPTCGPCKAMAPAFEALANELVDEPIRFIRINTAAQAQLAQPFHIHSVPTLLFVNNGEILDVRVGALPGPALAKKAQ